MKINKTLAEYADKLIIRLKADDKALISSIQGQIEDIHIYIQAQLSALVSSATLSGSKDVLDYDKLDRSMLSLSKKMNSFSLNQYNSIAAQTDKFTEKSFMDYRKDLESTLKKIDFDVQHIPSSNVQESAHNLVSVTFGGTPSKSFEKHLLGLLKAGSDPALLIKTLSQEHIRLLQRSMAVGLSKGRGFKWTADRFLKEALPKNVLDATRKQMEYNTTRILRTSYMNAINNDTTEFVAQNQDSFYGSRRVADGRPCIACIAQDGKIYKPGEKLVDHPNGQCILVPLTYPVEFFETGKITKSIKDPFGRSLKRKFYRMGRADQKKVFGNNKLFELWERERFDIEALVLPSGNPMSYQHALANLKSLKGVSFPSVNFATEALKRSINPLMDPIDRAQANHTVVRSKPRVCPTRVSRIKEEAYFLPDENIEELIEAKVLFDTECPNSWGLDMYGEPSKEKVMLSDAPDAVKAKIINDVPQFKNLAPFEFNDVARDLKIWIRKDASGKFYYQIPEKAIADILKAVEAAKTVSPIVSTKTKITVKKPKVVSKVEGNFGDDLTRTELLKQLDMKAKRGFTTESIHAGANPNLVTRQFSKDIDDFFQFHQQKGFRYDVLHKEWKAGKITKSQFKKASQELIEEYIDELNRRLPAIFGSKTRSQIDGFSFNPNARRNVTTRPKVSALLPDEMPDGNAAGLFYTAKNETEILIGSPRISGNDLLQTVIHENLHGWGGGFTHNKSWQSLLSRKGSKTLFQADTVVMLEGMTEFVSEVITKSFIKFASSFRNITVHNTYKTYTSRMARFVKAISGGDPQKAKLFLLDLQNAISVPGVKNGALEIAYKHFKKNAAGMGIDASKIGINEFRDQMQRMLRLDNHPGLQIAEKSWYKKLKGRNIEHFSNDYESWTEAISQVW